MSGQYETGMIGLGVMGRNLLLNIAGHGFSAAGYDKNPSQVEALNTAWMTVRAGRMAAQVELWPLAVYFGVTVLMTGGLLALSYILGQHHRETETDKPYESGIVSTGTARVRFDVKFYQNAIFFVIFDLEAMFVIAWAVAIRQAGWSGYIEIVVFIAVLTAALAYLWREGALDWAPRRRPVAAAEPPPQPHAAADGSSDPEDTAAKAPVRGKP